MAAAGVDASNTGGTDGCSCSARRPRRGGRVTCGRPCSGCRAARGRRGAERHGGPAVAVGQTDFALGAAGVACSTTCGAARRRRPRAGRHGPGDRRRAGGGRRPRQGQGRRRAGGPGAGAAPGSPRTAREPRRWCGPAARTGSATDTPRRCGRAWASSPAPLPRRVRHRGGPPRAGRRPSAGRCGWRCTACPVSASTPGSNDVRVSAGPTWTCVGRCGGPGGEVASVG